MKATPPVHILVALCLVLLIGIYETILRRVRRKRNIEKRYIKVCVCGSI
jgi:hypothetical protein